MKEPTTLIVQPVHEVKFRTILRDGEEKTPEYDEGSGTLVQVPWRMKPSRYCRDSEDNHE